jgi:hypothetical protein
MGAKDPWSLGQALIDALRAGEAEAFAPYAFGPDKLEAVVAAFMGDPSRRAEVARQMAGHEDAQRSMAEVAHLIEDGRARGFDWATARFEVESARVKLRRGLCLADVYVVAVHGETALQVQLDDATRSRDGWLSIFVSPRWEPSDLARDMLRAPG